MDSKHFNICYPKLFKVPLALCLSVLCLFSCNKQENKSLKSSISLDELSYGDIRTQSLSLYASEGPEIAVNYCDSILNEGLQDTANNIQIMLLKVYFLEQMSNYTQSLDLVKNVLSERNHQYLSVEKKLYALRLASKLSSQLGLITQAQLYTNSALRLCTSSIDSVALLNNIALVYGRDKQRKQKRTLLLKALQIEATDSMKGYVYYNLIEDAFDSKEVALFDSLYRLKQKYCLTKEDYVVLQWYQLILHGNEEKVLNQVKKALQHIERLDLNSPLVNIYIDLANRATEPDSSIVKKIYQTLEEELQYASEVKPSLLKFCKFLLSNTDHRSHRDHLSIIANSLEIVTQVKKFHQYAEERKLMATYLRDILHIVCTHLSESPPLKNSEHTVLFTKLVNETRAVEMQNRFNSKKSFTSTNRIHLSDAIIYEEFGNQVYRFCTNGIQSTVQLLKVSKTDLIDFTDQISEALFRKDTSYYRLAYKGYLNLWPSDFTFTSDRITIHPSQSLFTLSFDGLVSDTSRFDDFLLRKYDISFSFFVKNGMPTENTSKQKTKAYTADFSNSIRFTSLVNRVIKSKKINSTSLLRKLRSDSENILLTTHGYFNKEPYLFFSDDDSMSISQVIGDSFNTNYFIINACQSGNGGIDEIEGITNFAYAFSMAGIQNVVVNLWDGNSYAQRKINTALLDEKEPLNLRSAKLKYLQDENTSYDMKHPYYWAASVLYR